MGVVVSLSVDHQALKDTFELVCNFGQQGIHIAWLKEGSDIVIGIEPLARLLDPVADLGGDGFGGGVRGRL